MHALRFLLLSVGLMLDPLSPLAGQTQWTVQSSGTGDLLYGVAWGDNQFVAVGTNTASGTVLTSPDGIAWTVRSSGVGGIFYDVAYGNGTWVAVGTNSATSTAATSPDGITWTARTPGAGLELRGVAWTGSEFVAVGGTGGNAVVVTSPDGISWTGGTIGVASTLQDAASSGNVRVAVGSTGEIVRSVSGGPWQSSQPAPNVDWQSVTHSGGTFVAVGAGGQVATSPDGNVWTAQSSGTGDILYGLTSVDTPRTFVATGSNGRILTSADGAGWTIILPTNTSDVLYSVTHGDPGGTGRFVAVGTNGRILSSDGPGGGGGPAISVSISPDFTSWGSGGGTGSFNVSVTNPPLAWSVSASEGWLTVTGPASGTGNATVQFSVAPNTSGTNRAATVTLTGGSGPIEISIDQQGGPPGRPNLIPGFTEIEGGRIVDGTLESPSVHVRWDPVGAATGYRVERAVGDPDGPWNTFRTLPASQPEFTDHNVTGGEEYFYRAYARNAAGESDASVAVGGQVPPSAVDSLAATPVSYAEILVTWTDVAGGAEYTVERREAGGSGWTRVGQVPAGTESVADIGVQPEMTYEYRIGVRSVPAEFSTVPTFSAPSNVPAATTPPYDIDLYFNDPVEHMSVLPRRDLWNVVAAGGTRLAMGIDGFLLRSANGGPFAEVASGVDGNIFDAAHAAGTWVATNGSGGVTVSTDDGRSWTPVSIPGAGGTVLGILHDGARYVVFDSADGFHTSPDGFTWTSLSGPTSTGSGFLFRLLANPGATLYVAVFSDGSIQTASSLTGPWTERSPPLTGAFDGAIDAARGPAGFLVATVGGEVLTSPDGLSWTARDPGVSFSTLSVAGGEFVGLQTTDQAFPSADGVSWSDPVVLPEGMEAMAVLYSDNEYTVVGQGGVIAEGPGLDNLGVVRSPGDGVSTRLLGIADDGADTLVAVGERGQIQVGSHTTGQWSPVPRGPWNGVTLRDVHHDGTRWIAVGDEGIVLSSPDGRAWTEETRLGPRLQAVTSGPEGVLAAAPERLYLSQDLLSWTEVDFFSSANWRDLERFDGRYLAIGSTSAGAARSSPDTANWENSFTSGLPGSFRILRDGAPGSWGGQPLAVIVGDSKSFVSRDGLNWVRKADFTPQWGIYAVSGGPEGFVAGGKPEHVIGSVEGTIWQEAPDDLFYQPISGLGYWASTELGGRHYLAGSEGMIHSFVLSRTPAAAPGPLRTWADATFPNPTSARALPLGDYDRDAVPNYLEYFLRLDALANDWAAFNAATRPAIDAASGAASISLDVRPDPRIEVFMTWAENLDGPWSSAGVQRTETPATDGDISIAFDLPAMSSERRFVRLEFTYGP